MSATSLQLFYSLYGEMSEVKKRVFCKLLAEEGIDLWQVAILPQSRSQADYPVSSPQARVFLFEQLYPGTVVYNIPSIVRLADRLQVDLLRRALQQTIDRNEVLRLSFHRRNGEIRQVVHDSVIAVLDEDRIADAPEAEATAVLQSCIDDFARLPFDLQAPPLLRVRVLHFGDDEQYVVFVLHHLVADALSVRLLVREVGNRYLCLQQGVPFEEAPQPIQYVDYALWEQTEAGRSSRLRSLEYWRSVLGNQRPRLPLPADFPRPAVRSHRGAVHRLEVDELLVARLRDFARAEGVTLFVVLLTCYKILLARVAGVNDVPVAVPLSGRGRAELENLIGYFGNTVLCLSPLSQTKTVLEALVTVRDTVLGAQAHQDAPFEEMVASWRSGEPYEEGTYDAMFEFLDFRRTSFPTETSRESAWSVPMSLDFDVEVHTQTAKCALFLCCWESGQALDGVVEYDAELFAPATVAAWVKQYVCLLEALPGSRDRTIGELPLAMSPAGVEGQRPLFEEGFRYKQ